MLRPALLSIVIVASSFAQELLPNPLIHQPAGFWSDFPVLTTSHDGTPWLAYVKWNGTNDMLHVMKLENGALVEQASIGQGMSIIHQPAIATDGKGDVHVFWSQVNKNNLMELNTWIVKGGQLGDVTTVLASSSNGGNVFAKAATDPAGKVWLVWQSMRGTLADVFCRVFDPAKSAWSPEIQVTKDSAGDWEPCVAFAGDDAWVFFDSSRGNEFNIYGVKITPDLKVGETKTIIATDRFEGRVNAVGAKDDKGIWLACERGNQQWGLDMRAHGHPQGLNGCKDTVIAYLDLASGKVDELPSPDALFAALPGPQPMQPATPRANNPKGKAKAEAKAKNQTAEAKAKAEAQAKAKNEKAKANQQAGPNEVAAVNLPHLMLDAAGRP